MIRACIIEVSAGIFKLFKNGKIKLPAGVILADSRQCFDKDCLQIRLEGEGLPMWCQVPDGTYYPRASGRIRDDGQIELSMA
jgi:hypothetical protein